MPVVLHLRLKVGVRYGMVGQNGVGKSGEFKSSFRFSTTKEDTVLMHILGNNILVGLPQNIRILHIA